MEMEYCRRCGGELSTEDNSIYRCSNGHMLYVNSAPTASVLVVNQAGNLLLSRRGIEPGKGLLDVFGGFIDDMESVEDAAIRELQEETGLTPDQYEPLQYVGSGTGTYLFGGEARSILTLCFWTRIKPGVKLIANDDVSEIVELTLDEFKLDDLWNDDIRQGYKNIRAILQMSSR